MVLFEYSKWREKDFVNSLEMRENLSKVIEKMFSHHDPIQSIENHMKYGFNMKNEQVMGINDILRRLRKKKIDDLRKNLRGTYEELKNKAHKVADEEYDEIQKQLGEKIKSGKENFREEKMERENMLFPMPQSFTQSMQKLERYEEKKDFLSKQAKEMFQELKKDKEFGEKLEKFLENHSYGFVEGEPVSKEEAERIMKEYSAVEKIEESLRRGEIDIPDEIGEILEEDEKKSLDILRKLMEILKDEGFVVKKGNTLHLTPKGIRKIGEKVLKETFGPDIKSYLRGEHRTKKTGNFEIDYEERKKWEYGENANIDIFSSLKNAIMEGRFDRSGRINLKPEDFDIFKVRNFARTSCALLIDTSWSMSWGGKFECAKKVAIALHNLISSFFPHDNLFIIGFFTVAVQIKPHELASIELNAGDPFTNIQDALSLAKKLLLKTHADDKQIILITDGQPTACFLDGKLFVEWPVMGVSPTAMRETIKEVEDVTRKGIKINIFMVDDNSYVVKFVEEITKINKGRAFFTTPENLGKYILLDYLQNKRKLII